MATIYKAINLDKPIIGLVPTPTEAGQKTKIHDSVKEYFTEKGAFMGQVSIKDGGRAFLLPNTPENVALVKEWDEAGEAYLEKILGIKSEGPAAKNPQEILEARMARAVETDSKTIESMFDNETNERLKAYLAFAAEKNVPEDVARNSFAVHYVRPLQEKLEAALESLKANA